MHRINPSRIRPHVLRVSSICVCGKPFVFNVCSLSTCRPYSHFQPFRFPHAGSALFRNLLLNMLHILVIENHKTYTQNHQRTYGKSRFFSQCSFSHLFIVLLLFFLTHGFFQNRQAGDIFQIFCILFQFNDCFQAQNTNLISSEHDFNGA